MPNCEVLEPAIDPNNRISFLLDWEITMKCNLDCSYCDTGTHGGHDNSTAHPKLIDCLNTIDFMFRYVDLYMNTKPKGLKYVILNIYGGESLYHPDILKILHSVKEKYQLYKSNWHLTITTTTNAIVSEKKLLEVIPYIDEFTTSYHTEHTPKQRKQFKDNLLTIRDSGKRLKCVVLMHSDKQLFQDAQDMISWLSANNIKHLPRQLDHGSEEKKFIYDQQQVIWFNKLYNDKSHMSNDQAINTTLVNQQTVDLSDAGRACCGGRQLCKDQDFKSRDFFVKNKFPDWYCSVNYFFLFIKQINGEIYVNKDCKMNFSGTVGTIGELSNTDKLLKSLEENLQNQTLPVIQCKKSRCYCGLCAPKAKDLLTYNKIIQKYHKGSI